MESALSIVALHDNTSVTDGDGAEQAAANQTSGNYSFGNISMNTHSFNNVQGNKVDTSRYLDTGRSSVVTGSGDTLTTNRDGSRSLQAARADMAVSAEGLKSCSAEGFKS